MQVTVSEAKAQLLGLIRRVEAGEEVILTRHGHAVVRLVPIAQAPRQADRRQLVAEIRASARLRVTPGPSAAHSQDFLYNEDGLPQ